MFERWLWKYFQNFEIFKKHPKDNTDNLLSVRYQVRMQNKQSIGSVQFFLTLILKIPRYMVG